MSNCILESTLGVARKLKLRNNKSNNNNKYSNNVVVVALKKTQHDGKIYNLFFFL